MKKRIIIILMLFAFALISINVGQSSAQGKLTNLDLCAMPEFETFMFWYAKKSGWDKEEGLSFNIKFFNTGIDIIEALPAKQWVLGVTGGVPMLVGALRYNAYMIGIANDESLVNQISVRKNSDLLKVKGWNPKAPNAYGSPELIKGKTALLAVATSAHYTMAEYLKVFGLKETDIIIKSMDPPQMLAAFDSGIGDMACIWPPWYYTGLQRGNKSVFAPVDAGTALPMTLVGEKKFCDENPELVVKFLRVYFRGINMLKNEITTKGASDKLIKEYIIFFDEWAGQKWEYEFAKMDLELHPIYDAAEQMKIFDDSKGISEAQKWQNGILDFFSTQGRFNAEEVAKIKSTKYINNKFIKLTNESIVNKPLGGYDLK